jgi:hypothetical protein
VLIHPGPVSGSEFFDSPFDLLLVLFCRTEVIHPSSFGLDPLDVKSQEVESIVDMGEFRFLL